jgi:Xaa-Pro aminopeptidase
MADPYATRLARAQQLTAALGAGAALIASGINVRYLTGLASSNAAVLVPAAGDPVLATDSRYAPAARRDCAGLDLVVERDVTAALAALATSRGLAPVAVEEHQLTVAAYRRLEAAGLTLAATGPLVEELRMVKDAGEIALLRRACQITDEALAAALAGIRPGLTERELAVALEREMISRGAEQTAFDTIVASGPNGDTPHHVPGGRPLARGDLITIDCGARYAGYHADLTRTVALRQVAAWQRDLYALVAAAQRAGTEAAVDGAATAAVDAAARDVIAAAGHGAHFGHGTGHGVGLEIHEAPMLSATGTGTLAGGVPLTVEPGIYVPGQGGVRIEDTLVVRAGPGAIAGELLTTTPRELLVL